MFKCGPMKIDLKSEDGERREKLLSIYDHVGEIAKKIASMDDPLPEQLQKSIPRYIEGLATNADRLTHSRCSVVIAGENTSDKSYVINAILGEDLLPCHDNTETAVVCDISYDDDSWCQVHFWEPTADPIALKDADGFGKDLAGFIHARAPEISDWPYQRADIFTHSQVICDGVTVVDVPNVGHSEALTRIILDRIYECATLVYVLECMTSGDIVTEQMQKLMRALTDRSPMKGLGKKFLPVASVVFVFCCPDQESMNLFVRETAIKNLQEQWPGVDDSQIFFLCTAECLSPVQKEMTSTEFFRLLSCIERLALVYLEHRMQITYSWLHSFVCRVLHHLRAYLSQSEKTDEERKATFLEIQLRLTQLTGQADEFFKKLREELDGKVNEASVMLRAHLTSEEVMNSLSNWSEEEMPNEQIWQEVDASIRDHISHKLYVELSKWEEEKGFFKNLRPQLIQHFQKQFYGIEKQLTMVETMIARHDSRLCLLELAEGRGAQDDADQCVGLLPYTSLHLNLGQKIALGVAAPLLVPIALGLAVLGLPIIAGISAKDLIVEKIAENKLKEYNTDRVKYIKKRIPEELRKFVKSRSLEQYIRTQLRPAYRCLEQLEEVVPGQIDADMCHVDSLRCDARQAKDFARFYAPLVQIFEYDKQMLTLFRVMHIQREKLDLKFSQVTQPQTMRTICQGLSATIQGDFWVDDDIFRSRSKRAVSLRKLNEKLEPRTVQDYLHEEEAYRWQACPQVVKFYGVTKDGTQLYHMIEPLSCSLRHYLHNASEAAPEVSDKVSFNFFKGKMIEVIRGLDYLHDRGWVHFDLSLDTVAVNGSAKVKLTNISSRKMVKVDRNLPPEQIQQYGHLPHEVLVDPPAAYTPASEMYCAGIMMWEMWSRERAFEEEIMAEDDPLDTVDKLVAYMESGRPHLEAFHDAKGRPTSAYADVWLGLLQQCWAESERLTSKALQQLMDDTRTSEALNIKEGHFTKD